MRIRHFFFSLPILLLLFVGVISLGSTVFAVSDQEKAAQLESKIAEYQAQIKTLQAKQSTLANQIAQFNAQINLTELKITQTEDQISLLGGRIGQLSGSVDGLTKAFDARVIETYKISRLGNNPMLLLTSPSVKDALNRYEYLTRIQEADQTLLSRLQKAQDTYQNQKSQQEALQKTLDVQKADLNGQKASKAQLLLVTKNDEKKYQELLASARSEFDAIQAILSGHAQEDEVGHVNAGDKIASIIGWAEWKNGGNSSSCNSSAAHTHFIVSKNGQTENPFSYLKSGVDYENCSGPGGCSSGDSFNPSGSWNWPISPKITFNQGYGHTWAVDHTWVGKVYQFHNGIDITSQSSSEVKAVQPGTLYRGSFSGQSGCRLRYVRVKHDSSELNTYYLHINY